MLKNPLPRPGEGTPAARCETKGEGSMAEHTQRRSPVVSDKIAPDDPRYDDLVGRGSRRFAGKPDYVRVVCSTEQVVDAVQDAVGGSCGLRCGAEGTAWRPLWRTRRCGW
jgi:hypothetical protein